MADTLYRIAFYLLESEAEAEDAVQELYLRLWESRDSLDGIRLPKAYAIRMLKNICIDRIRKASHETCPEELPQTGFDPAPDDALDARARLDKVLEAVKALPERQRIVLILRTVDGLSYEEMLDKYIERYWSPIKESEQPFEAFRINSGHIRNALIRAIEEES